MTAPDETRATGMVHSRVPYVPASPPQRPAPPPVPPAAQPVPVVGDTVDLAHELAQLRRQLYVVVTICSLALVAALFAMVFSGYVAYYLYHFIDALQKAFGR